LYGEKVISDLTKKAISDARLAGLLDEAREYAEIYLLAKQRHKGCEGTGELVSLREEFRDVIGKLMKYCGANNYPCEISGDDADAAARALASDTIRR
jgi:hypothetical protein